MNNIIWLTKIYIKESIGSMFSKVNKNKKRGKYFGTILLLVLFVFIAVNMGVSFFGYGKALQTVNMQNYILYYGMIYFNLLIIALLSYQTQDIFFRTKDFNLLSSLPIKNYQIIISKFLALLSWAYLFEVAIMIPAMVIYYLFVPFTLLGFLFFLILFLLMPMFGLFLGSVAILIINIISSRAVRKDKVNLFLILFFMLFIIAMFLYVNFAGLNQLIVNQAIPSVLNYLLPMSSLMFWAIDGANFGLFALSVGINIVLALVSILLLSFVYLKINQNFGNKHKAVKEKKNFKQQSVLSRLVHIELKNFFDKPVYVFNAGFGMLLLTVTAIGLPIYFFVNRTQLMQDPSTAILFSKEMFLFMYCFIPLFMVLMSSTTHSTISLEGNSIYFKKSLPIDFKTIAWSKIIVNLMLGLPILLLFCTILPIMIIVGLNIFEILICFFLPILAMIFVSFFGLMVNLWFPKLNWTNVTLVVKNSTSALVTIFGGMAIVLLAMALFLSVGVSSLYLAIGALILFAILILVFARLVFTKGKDIYNKL